MPEAIEHLLRLILYFSFSCSATLPRVYVFPEPMCPINTIPSYFIVAMLPPIIIYFFEKENIELFEYSPFFILSKISCSFFKTLFFPASFILKT